VAGAKNRLANLHIKQLNLRTKSGNIDEIWATLDGSCCFRPQRVKWV